MFWPDRRWNIFGLSLPWTLGTMRRDQNPFACQWVVTAVRKRKFTHRKRTEFSGYRCDEVTEFQFVAVGVTIAKMAAKTTLIEVSCPCCQAVLKIDPATQSVITYQEHERPRAISDIEAAAQALKGEGARREQLFQKSVEAHKNSADVLSKKFDELLKKAQADDPDKPPPKPIGLD